MSKRQEKTQPSPKEEKKPPVAEKPETEAPTEEEAKPEKPVKAPRAEKKKKQEKSIYKLYKIENEKATRLRPTCERCGPGYFMADHGNRYTCGHCGYTRYKPADR